MSNSNRQELEQAAKPDLISRSELIMQFCESPDYSASMFKKIRQRIKTAPAVDAVPVIRCKDCDMLIYLNDYPADDYPYCEWWQHEVYPEFDYCSKAERKTDV